MTANVLLILQLFFMKGQYSRDTTLIRMQLPAFVCVTFNLLGVSSGTTHQQGGKNLLQISGSYFLQVLLRVHWPKTFN